MEQDIRSAPDKEELQEQLRRLSAIDFARKKLVIALDEQFRFLQLLIDTIPDPVFYSDTNGRYLGCNRAFEEFLGVTKGRIFYKTVYDLSPKDLADIYNQKDAELFAHPTVQRYETQVKHADGSRRDVIFNKAAFFDSQGNVSGLIGIILDITDRKEMECKVRQVSEEWDRTINAIADLLFIQDAEHNIIKVNRALLDFLGLPEEQVVGKKCYEVMHRSGHPLPGCPMAKTSLDRKPHTEEVSDESTGLTWLISTSPIFDEKGEVKNIVHISRDITARKIAEKDRKQLAAIVENSDDAVISEDLNGVIMSWNKGAEKIYGFTAEEVVGKPFFELLQPDKVEERKGLLEKVRSGEHIAHFQTQRYSKSGRIFYVSISMSPLRNESGQIYAASTIARDITEQKMAQDLIAQSRDYYLKLFEDFPALIWRSSRDGKFDYVNKAWLEFTGRSMEKELGDGWTGNIFPADVKKCFDAYTDSFERRLPLVMEFRMRHYDKSFHWFVNYGRPFYDLDGGFAGFIGSCYDITERKLAEQALASSEEKFRTLVQNVNVGVYRNTPDPRGKFLQINEAMAKIFGYGSAEEMMRMPVVDIYYDPGQRREFLEEIKENKVVVNREFQGRKKDGTVFWFSVNATAAFDENKEVSWIDGVISDISERKALELDLQRKMAILERFQRVTVGRELRMKELKVRIRELESRFAPDERMP